MRVAELSLNALAREVGLAKSNVLRYFESREAVLLELYDRETKAWLDALAARLVELPASLGGVEPGGDRDRRYRRGPAGLLRPVRQRARGAGTQCVRDRGRGLQALGDRQRDQTRRAGRPAARRTAVQFHDRSGRRRCNLIIGGTWTTSQPSPGMAAAYAAHPELRARQLDQRVAIRELVATLLTGLQHRTPSID